MRRGLSLFRPASDLERMENAQDCGWVEQLNEQLQSERLLTAWMAGRERSAGATIWGIHGKRFHCGWE